MQFAVGHYGNAHLEAHTRKHNTSVTKTRKPFNQVFLNSCEAQQQIVMIKRKKLPPHKMMI